MHDNSEQDGTSTQAAISKLEEMTAQLRWAKDYIESLPIDRQLADSVTDYSVALSFAATAAHGLNRKLYLLENPPKAQLSMNDIIHQMRRSGVTVDDLRLMLERQRAAKQEGATGGFSRASS
jgi:hypothetical protein